MEQQQLPGEGLWGWLGRQLGYVTRAVKTEVNEAGEEQVVVHRQERVEEKELPGQQGVVLRRTTTDEVVVKRDNG